MASAAPTPGGPLINTPLITPSTGPMIHTSLIPGAVGPMIHTTPLPMPGGQQIQTPLIHPSTGPLINNGQVLRGALISHLKTDEPIKLTPAVEAFLRAIQQTTLGVPHDTLPYDEGVGRAAARLGSPLSRLGNNLIHQGTAFSPFEISHPSEDERYQVDEHGQITEADPSPVTLAFARWLRGIAGPGRTSITGMSPGTHYPLTPDELGEIFKGHGDPAARLWLIKVLREGLLDEPGTENN